MRRPTNFRMNRSREKNWSGDGRAGNRGRRTTVRRSRATLRRALERAGCNCNPDLSRLSDAELLDAMISPGGTVPHQPWCRIM